MQIRGSLGRFFHGDHSGGQLPFQGTDGYKVLVSGELHTIPYRYKFSKSYVPSDDIPHYCRRSRSSGGYKRETALRELVSHDLDALAAAYVLVALGDYVLPINTLPLGITVKTRKELRKLVKENPELVQYLDALTISYWNEYYRYDFARYADYPAYKFLQELKKG